MYNLENSIKNGISGEVTIPDLLQLLSSQQVNVFKQAHLHLRSIFKNGQPSEFIQHLLPLINESTPVDFLKKITWIIVDLCKKPIPIESIEDICSAVNILMHQTDENILIDAVVAVSHLTRKSVDQIQLVIDSGILSKLVPLLGHHNEKLRKAALNSIDHITSKSEKQMQTVLDYQILKYFHKILRYAPANIRMKALRVLSNITAGNEFQLDTVFRAGLIPALITVLWHGDFKTQIAAVFVLSNMTRSCTKNHIYELLKQNVIAALGRLLLQCSNLDIIKLILKFFAHVLSTVEAEEVEAVTDKMEDCLALDRIEELQYHDNEAISGLASQIVKFFPEEKCDENIEMD